jgi:hypothetical protein
VIYKKKSEWQLARNSDWSDKRPAKQKLTKSVSVKGSTLYSVYVGTDDHGRMKAELQTWSVTSLRKFKKVSFSYGGPVKKANYIATQ